MRSLLLKIFLWFGLAMVVVNVASFATGILIERRSQSGRGNPMAPMLAAYAQTAVEILERDGKAELAAYLERVRNSSHVDAVVLNEQGEELSGREPLPGAQEVAVRALQTSGFLFEVPNQRQHPLGAQWVTGPSGRRYALVAQLPRPGFPGPPPPRFGERGSLGFARGWRRAASCRCY